MTLEQSYQFPEADSGDSGRALLEDTSFSRPTVSPRGTMQRAEADTDRLLPRLELTEKNIANLDPDDLDELVTNVEEAFGIQIPADEAAQFSTLRDVARYVQSQQNGTSKPAVEHQIQKIYRSQIY